MRFDGTDDWLQWASRVTTIRTVFWVVRETPGISNSYRHLLGDSSGYPFSSGAAHQIWSTNYASTYVTGGQTRLNGLVVNGTTTNRPTDPAIIGVSTSGPVSADRFSGEAGTTSYRWHGDLAELVVYDRVLSDSERQQVEQYLGARHGITVP